MGGLVLEPAVISRGHFFFGGLGGRGGRPSRPSQDYRGNEAPVPGFAAVPRKCGACGPGMIGIVVLLLLHSRMFCSYTFPPPPQVHRVCTRASLDVPLHNVSSKV